MRHRHIGPSINLSPIKFSDWHPVRDHSVDIKTPKLWPITVLFKKIENHDITLEQSKEPKTPNDDMFRVYATW